MSFIGNGYPDAGNYTGTHNRTMTVVGSKNIKRYKKFVWRDKLESVKKKEYPKMNMTHFHDAKNKAKIEKVGIHTSCLAELYRQSRSRDEDL